MNTEAPASAERVGGERGDELRGHDAAGAAARGLLLLQVVELERVGQRDGVLPQFVLAGGGHGDADGLAGLLDAGGELDRFDGVFVEHGLVLG